VVNREEPQSKQIETFGNANTPGLSMFLMPLKWISISVVNSQNGLARGILSAMA
jgi:hypothetical protein